MDAKKIGRFIAEQRKSLGLTQAELAEKLYVTDKAVSRWERGQGLPDINTIEPLAEALKVSIAEVMKGERNTDGLPSEDASSAVKNIIDLVGMKREEHKRIAIVVTVAALVIFCILLIDVMGFPGFIGVAVPCFGLAAGIMLLCAAVICKRRKRPVKAMLIWAAVFIAVPLVFVILFFTAGALGTGPVPN